VQANCGRWEVKFKISAFLFQSVVQYLTGIITHSGLRTRRDDDLIEASLSVFQVKQATSSSRPVIGLRRIDEYREAR
jgi:hypothetical protein